ncbi:tRNA (adenosine(37)-N6)-threonylcarbamoyltransferase complex dimerization subunit type 1 TsaB [Mycoplasmopsis citelli]|uniref:Molecular chaperone n=1 Tax=Mycoplasmopsis citelli TaxID=171281 RepID=A0A449B1Y8_9BACT|nr:tRNA (adenosine(37)-N6)-threonylcarbamoyltransferase complex dimerization subunit type 1 TsaB [Mycoplasmopsis citelli]UUD36073.1 tRNA (adenosine(37)-N6)-threonylcarbamoyltransferase complex dimerization subunit type 1 TsaB [Mycoplasmopsis citelli]VEU74618.1 molecular chaperone [Mycoplasmopsis citelli]
MNIFLDTAGSDLVIILFNDDFKVLDYVHEQGVKQKVELLTQKFDDLMNFHNLSYFDIKSFYINKGPGFFTGVRIALVFARSIALWTNAKMYTTNTFLILKKQISKRLYVLDASGGKKYLLGQKTLLKGNIKNIENSISVDVNNKKTHDINYNLVINSFKNYQDIFTEEKILDITPLYVKKPQIGGLK